MTSRPVEAMASQRPRPLAIGPTTLNVTTHPAVTTTAGIAANSARISRMRARKPRRAKLLLVGVWDRSYCEIGNCEIGNCEIGNCEIGNCEIENCEIGNCEIENCEIGNCEIGNCEIGNCEIGNREIGN